MDTINSILKDKNEGITCSVDNCTYHEGTDCCVAKKIHVGPNYAVSSDDTVCDTFKQK